MKKILVLAMLCVFSIVGVQAAEAKTPDKEMKNRPQIEKKFDKKEKKDFKYEDKKYKKHSYSKNNSKYANKHKMNKYRNNDAKKFAHHKKSHKRGHKIGHYHKKPYYSRHNTHRSFHHRHSFYR